MGDDVARAERIAGGHVLRHGDGGGDVDLQVETGRGDDGGDHRGGTAHVGDHVVHVGARLDGDTTGVEGDALAHQRDMRRCLAVPPGQAQQAWFADRAVAHGQDATESVGGQLVLVEDLRLEPVPGGLIGGDDRVGLRVEVGGGGVDQVAGQNNSLDGDLGRHELVLVATEEVDGQGLVDAIPRIIITRPAQPLEGVGTQTETGHGGGQSEFADGGGDILVAGQRPGDGAGGAAEFFVVKLLGRAETDGDHRRDILESGHAGDLVGLALRADSLELPEDARLLLVGEDVIELVTAGELRGIPLAGEQRHDNRVDVLGEFLIQLELSDPATDRQGGVPGHLGWGCGADGVLGHRRNNSSHGEREGTHG